MMTNTIPKIKPMPYILGSVLLITSSVMLFPTTAQAKSCEHIVVKTVARSESIKVAKNAARKKWYSKAKSLCNVSKVKPRKSTLVFKCHKKTNRWVCRMRAKPIIILPKPILKNPE
ncbi:MAG: hypothetical protein ACWA5U_08275 [bacterium]